VITRAKATIKGIVQGVGFRPFVYQLARKKGLGGYVLNTSEGVDIEVEGEQENIESFFEEIQIQKPPLARITSVETQYLPHHYHYDDFMIRPSRIGAQQSVLISPDICICDDCLREMKDPADRRYRYPFINCTNCGPRYTIIKDIPYDRKNTTMASFTMCDRCQQEYDDPLSRRFHAQPNACSDCGPHVSLYDHAGQVLHGIDPVGKTRELLKEGKIVAIKGIGGFHLACDATNGNAVTLLRERKNREEKPLAIMSSSLEKVKQYALVGTIEAATLSSKERPIVLLPKKEGSAIAGQVAPRNRYLGVMLPYTPLHYLILGDDLLALVMTSGNLSEEPIAIDNDEAFRRLSGIADCFLVHDREIYMRNDDSVVRVVGEKVRMIRRSRGYVPVPIFLPFHAKPTLACGPYLSNTICIAEGEHAFLSQHVGDLENLEATDSFELTVEHLKDILEIEPGLIACDLHPDYYSTQYALRQEGIPQVSVQHHHAHIASCMAENGINKTVIGLALDGTGYGSDGTLWGGEILIADFEGFERAGHFQYVPLPGGEAAIREPWRMALSLLYQAFGKDLFDLPLEFVQRLDRLKAGNILTMIERKINCPLTSSCGRLFDGIAALVGVRDRVSYKGQAAIELEMEMGEGEGLYPVTVPERGECIIPQNPIIHGVISDLRQGVDRGTVIRKFHNTLVEIFTDVCLKLQQKYSLNRVCLSGGVFQNIYLLENLEKALIALDFEVYTHSIVPPNDGGVALGQVIVANAILKREDG
jgi:hydrogenase maturation protein HypF